MKLPTQWSTAAPHHLFLSCCCSLEAPSSPTPPPLRFVLFSRLAKFLFFFLPPNPQQNAADAIWGRFGRDRRGFLFFLSFPSWHRSAEPRRGNICCVHLQQHNDLNTAHGGVVTRCRFCWEMLRPDDALLRRHSSSLQWTMGSAAPWKQTTVGSKGLLRCARVCVHRCKTSLINTHSVFVFLRLVAPLITERAIYQREKKKQFTKQPVLPRAWIRIDSLSRCAP